MNTRVTYRYTDAANYHLEDDFVVGGELHFVDLEPYLDDEGFFIPSDVGLADLWAQRLRVDPDDDHPWHHFEEEEDAFRPTGAKATSFQSAEEVIAAFKAAHERGWSEEEVSKEIQEVAEPYEPEEDYPVCESCGTEIDEQELPFCSSCRDNGAGDEDDDEDEEEETEAETEAETEEVAEEETGDA